MKLSDYKGEEALDVLADLIEPAAVIMADKDLAAIVKSKQPMIKAVSLAIKNHKHEVIQVLAALERENPDTYAEKVTFATLPAKVLEIVNDKELISLFQSQGQMTDSTSSGSASENIKE